MSKYLAILFSMNFYQFIFYRIAVVSWYVKLNVDRLHKITTNGLWSGEGGDFTTNVHTKHILQIYEKLSYKALKRHFCQTAVLVAQFPKYTKKYLPKRFVFCIFKYARKKRTLSKNALSSSFTGLNSGA